MLLDFLFGDDKQARLLHQQNFAANYQLVTKTTLKMGEENAPIEIVATAAIRLEQVVEKRKIYTTVTFQDITCETEDDNMKDFLEEIQMFAKINPTVQFRRNSKGEVKEIANKEEMWDEWREWKHTQLPQLIPDAKKQQAIAENYERGFEKMLFDLPQTYQYLLLLPECYKFTNYPNPQDAVYKYYVSRFVGEYKVGYYLRKRQFSYKNSPFARLSLSAGDFDFSKDDELERFYKEALPDFSAKDYGFNVHANYLFRQETSEIINATFTLTEQLHPNFVYNIELELTNTDNKEETAPE